MRAASTGASIGSCTALTNCPSLAEKPSTTVARSPQHIDAFVVGSDQGVYSTWWDITTGWAGWFRVAGGAAAPGSSVTVLARNPHHLDLFVVGTGTRAQQFVTDCGAMVDHFASLATHPLVYLAFPPRAFANTYGISGTIIHDQILPLIQQVATAKGV